MPLLAYCLTFYGPSVAMRRAYMNTFLAGLLYGTLGGVVTASPQSAFLLPL